MKSRSARTLIAAGACAVALSLTAAPAFAQTPFTATTASVAAAPAAPVAAPAPATTPVLKITPRRVTLNHYVHAGVMAHFTGFAAGETVSVTWSTVAAPATDTTAQAPAPVPNVVANTKAKDGTWTADADGTLTVHVRPAKKDALPGSYTVTGTAVAVAATEAAPAPAAASSAQATFAVGNSKITWKPAHRTGAIVKLEAVAAKWSAKKAALVAWQQAKVKFQAKVGSHWKTVKVVRTNTHGVAVASVKAKAHTWRAVVVASGSTTTDITGTHKK